MVRIHRWSPDEGHIPLLTAGPEADYVALRTAEPLTALMSTPSGPRLYHIEEGTAHLIGQAERAIHGPVRHDDALYFLADGLLMRWMNGESTSMGPVDWTCLFEIEGHPHVCVLRNLHRVDIEGGWQTGPAVFRLDDFMGVDEACPGEPVLRTECLAQWYHYGAEAGLVNPADVQGDVSGDASDLGLGAQSTVADGATTRSESSGCAVVSDFDGPLWAFLILFSGLFALRRIL